MVNQQPFKLAVADKPQSWGFPKKKREKKPGELGAPEPRLAVMKQTPLL